MIGLIFGILGLVLDLKGFSIIGICLGGIIVMYTILAELLDTVVINDKC